MTQRERETNNDAGEKTSIKRIANNTQEENTRHTQEKMRNKKRSEAKNPKVRRV